MYEARDKNGRTVRTFSNTFRAKSYGDLSGLKTGKSSELPPSTQEVEAKRRRAQQEPIEGLEEEDDQN